MHGIGMGKEGSEEETVIQRSKKPPGQFSWWLLGCWLHPEAGVGGGGRAGVEFEGKTTSRVFGDVVIVFRDPGNPQNT
ncbi:hypothetical protein Moror_3543, partial [Moniliophthora roreri MCA 2997]